jgi:biopolymer transport protein ExbD
LASWDVFHADRLELERGLSAQAIREALARGALRDDDLVRPSGTTVIWERLADIPELLAAPPEAPAPVAAPQAPAPVPAPATTAPRSAPPLPPGAALSDFEVQVDDAEAEPSTPTPTLRAPDWFQLRSESDDVAFPVMKEQQAKPPAPPSPGPATEPAWLWAKDDDEEPEDDEQSARLEVLDDDRAGAFPAGPSAPAEPEGRSSRVALPVVAARGWDDTRGDVEGEEEVDFSLARSGPQTVEELDLAPMVDVAFQLVLFFMVTATTVLFKTLDIPKPSTESPPSAVAQGRSRTLDDLKEDYILVEVDSSGAMKIDREPVAADMDVLVERLRQAREKTHRQAMLLSADYATKHRSAVLAYDAALEIGLGIVIARPQAPQGPGPALVPSAAPNAGRPAGAPAAAATPPESRAN